jgi:hypothetical protein
VSWVEEAKHEALKQEASESNVSSTKDPFVTVGFASVTEGAANQDNWRAAFALMIEGAASQGDWSATVVVDLVWETKILPGDEGWNASLAKREC